MRDFIAFDFETANRNRHSICSVGMVFVENGRIVDSEYQLINPEEEFDRWNIAIHHITPKDVVTAPTFDQFYARIEDKIEHKLMVAHNLPFDGYALRDNLNRYNVKPKLNHLLCTLQLSKRLMIGHPSYKLDSLCRYFGIKLNNHHHALDDAKACAQLLLKLSEKYELSDVETIYEKTNIQAGEISEVGYRSSLVKKAISYK